MRSRRRKRKKNRKWKWKRRSRLRGWRRNKVEEEKVEKEEE